jgi:hypothetical protein
MSSLARAHALPLLGTVLALAAGCGAGEHVTVYLKQRLGPDGPPGQRAPVLSPAARAPCEGMPAARQAVLELLVGPSPRERGQGFLDTIPLETRLLGVRVQGGLAVVELAGGEPGVYGAAAIVYSLTALPGIRAVELRLDGRPCCAHTHDGSVISPLSRELYRLWSGEPCAERTYPDAVRCRRDGSPG